MARVLILGSVAVAWLLSPCAMAQPVMLEEPSAAVKMCITRNATEVEKAFESLNEGADFLTQKICAAEIADQVQTWSEEHARKEKQAFADQIKAACADRAKVELSSDQNPNFDDMMCDRQSIFGLDYSGGTSLIWQSLATAPKTSALAAQALLKLRVARLSTKQ